MRLSQTSEYALRAVLHIAEAGNGRALPAGEIAAHLDVPRNYLSKILHQLRQRGVLTSARGPRGGFRLVEPPDRVTIADLIEPHDPISEERHCLLGRPECLDSAPCPAHARWREVGEILNRFFHDTTLADLLSPEREEGE